MIVLLFAFSAFARAELCGPWLTDRPVGVSMHRSVDDVADITTLKFTVDRSPEIFATASRVGQLLQFRFERGVESDGERVLTGPDVIRMALAEFGPRVRVVESSWYFGDELKVYNEALRKGLTPDEAAAQTWTARTLARYGFEVFSIDITLGEAGRHSLVLGHFRKPRHPFWRKWLGR